MGLTSEKIEWSQEAPTREKLWFIAVLGLVVYLCYMWLWDPQMTSTKHMEKKMETLQVQEESLKKVLSVKIDVPVIAPQPQAEVSRDDPRFAPYFRGEIKRRDEVLREVSQALTSARVLKGIELMGMTFEAEVDRVDYDEIPFQLRARGRFNRVVRYLEQVEAAPILAILRGVEVLSPEADRSHLDVTLKGATFVIKSASALTSSGAPP